MGEKPLVDRQLGSWGRRVVPEVSDGGLVAPDEGDDCGVGIPTTPPSLFEPSAGSRTRGPWRWRSGGRGDASFLSRRDRGKSVPVGMGVAGSDHEGWRGGGASQALVRLEEPGLRG